MPLHDIQARFYKILLSSPETLPGDFAGLFKRDHISLPDRLDIYRNNVVGSLSEAVMATFPLIEKLVGREFLQGMARLFVLQNPPREGCLNHYGAGFDDFIRNFKPAESLPYLPDVAAMEIALNAAYFAPDDAPLTPDMLAAIHLESLGDTVLKLRSSATMLHSRFPLEALRDFCLSDGKTPAPDVNAGGGALMIYRPALETSVVALEPAEFDLLNMLAGGTPFGQSVQRIITRHDGFILQGFLERHMNLETFGAL